MDGAINASASTQSRIRRVHNRVDLLLGDVPLEHFKESCS